MRHLLPSWRKAAGQDWQPGDRVYRYVWTGGTSWEPQPLTVVSVAPKTVLVRTDVGSEFRIDKAEIEGLVDWE